MTKALKEAFEQASKPEQAEREALGRWLLEELASQKRWDQLLADSQDELGLLGREALAEHRAGRTHPLEPDEL